MSVRNFEAYIKHGKEKINSHHGYELYFDEFSSLMKIVVKDGSDGLINAIRHAYEAGVEAGYRMRKHEEERGGKG